jgi:hypothetical protein
MKNGRSRTKYFQEIFRSHITYQRQERQGDPIVKLIAHGLTNFI